MDYHKLDKTDHKKNIFDIIIKACKFYEIKEFIQTEMFITCYLDSSNIRVDISMMDDNNLIILTTYLDDKFFATRVIHNDLSPLIKVSRIHELFDQALDEIDNRKILKSKLDVEQNSNTRLSNV